MPETAVRIAAAPTLLVGIGAVGERVARFLGERVSNTFLAESGMLVVLDADDPTALDRGIARLTRQRHVLAAESGLDLRAPADRYLRLQLIAVGNAEEMLALAPNPLLAIAEGFLNYPHPPEGLRLGFVLDASGQGRVDSTPAALPELLREIESRAQNSAPNATVVLAHRKLLDGTHLDHPNLEDPAALDPDEFERTLAGLMEAMLRPGGDAAWSTRERPVNYLFVGGGSTVFPRELLLGSTARLLGADLLERTRAPMTHPESETILVPSRDDLVQRLLKALDRPAASIEPRVREAKCPSLFARIFDDAREAEAAQGIGVRVPAALGALNSATPEELAATYESKGEALRREFETELIPALDAIGPGLTADLLASVRKELDEQIGRELGGVDRALRSIEATQRAILAGLTPEERALLAKAEPHVSKSGATAPLGPPYVERSTDDFPESTKDLLDRFRGAVRRLPKPVAVAARALLVGAVLSPLAPGTVGGLIAMAASGLLFGGAWILGRAKVERMRAELLLRLEDSLGQVAYAETHELLGLTERSQGVLPAIWRYLEDWERPLVRGFDGLRDSGLDLMRRIDEWPDGFLPGVDWLDVPDPFELHDDRRYEPSALTEAARRVLEEKKAFAGWRHPSFPTIETALAGVARDERLRAFELGAKPLGEFVRHLCGLYDEHDPDGTFARRVVTRLDRLAVRCLPLAPNMDEHAGETVRSLRLSVPASLAWTASAHRIEGSPENPPGGIPSTSGFAGGIAWLFPEGQAVVADEEADHATALALFPAPDAATAAAWLGLKSEAPR